MAKSTFYISTAGNDSWLGKLPEPNKMGTDGPFATPERAREGVRVLKRSGSIPRGGVTVSIRGGDYPVASTFTLTAEDSGTETSPVVWSGYGNERVRFVGGKRIGGFAPVTDTAILSRIAEQNRHNILQADLKAQGIADYGKVSPRGPLGLELFFNGKAMTMARYPNEGWLTIADVPQTGEKRLNEGTHWDKSAVPRGRHYGRFVYDGDRPRSWKKSDDMYMHGFWTWDWADEILSVGSIDTEKREIRPAEPHHVYGYKMGQRYFFFNILEELDSPGEWYLDRTNGIIYFWPPSPIEEGEVFVSLLEQTMLSLEEASHVTVRKIRFEYSRGDAVHIKGGTGNVIAGCTVRNIGGNGVNIDGGTKNGVLSCDISDLATGIILGGGDRKTLAAGGNYATNNHIHHFGRIMNTSQIAVQLSGVGNLLSHNLMHDAPHAGVFFSGNEHILEYNVVHDILNQTGDAGAFYIGRDWTMRGNTIRYNYFYNINGPGAAGVNAVYLDDFASGQIILGNVFYNVLGNGVRIAGGRDNRVEGNIFVKCEPSIEQYTHGLNWASYMFDKKDANYNSTMFDRMDAVNYSQPPFSAKYPELLTLYDDEPAAPKHNVIVSNVSFGGRWHAIFWVPDHALAETRNNIIADPIICHWYKKYRDKCIVYKLGDPAIMELFKDNLFVDGDPGFVDAANRNFDLRKDSRAWKLGFQPIPFEKMGLYRDEYRATLPAEAGLP